MLVLILTVDSGPVGSIIELPTVSQNTAKLRVAAAGLGLDPVASLVELAAISVAGLPTGSSTYVNDVRDFYVYDAGSVEPADGFAVVAPAVGPGRWIARLRGRWDDLQGAIDQGVGTQALTYEEYRDTPFLMFFWRSNQDDELNFVFQLPHKWLRNTPIFAHMHVIPMASPAVPQVAFLQGSYALIRTNGTLPALSGWTPFTAPFTVNPGDAYVERIASLFNVTPAPEFNESTLLIVHLERAALNPLDTYKAPKDHGISSANLGLLSADVHYRSEKMGTLQPFAL